MLNTHYNSVLFKLEIKTRQAISQIALLKCRVF